MFGYGFLAVVLVLYLAAAGLDPLAIGIVLTLTLIGDVVISLWLTTNADRLGRRRVLVAGALLMLVGGRRLRRHELGAAAHPGRRDRRHLTDRQRGRSVPRRRAGGPHPDGPGQPQDGDVRLVQPRRLRRHRDGRAGGGPAQPGAHRRRGDGGRRLPRDRHRLRGHRRGDGDRLLAARRGDRSPAASRGGRGHPAAVRARALEVDRPAPVAPVLARRFRWWLHPAEPDRLLVPPRVRGRAGGARRDLLRGQPPRRRLVAVGRPHRGADRADQHDGLHPPAVERAALPRSRSCRRCRSPSRSSSCGTS